MLRFPKGLFSKCSRRSYVVPQLFFTPFLPRSERCSETAGVGHQPECRGRPIPPTGYSSLFVMSFVRVALVLAAAALPAFVAAETCQAVYQVQVGLHAFHPTPCAADTRFRPVPCTFLFAPCPRPGGGGDQYAGSRVVWVGSPVLAAGNLPHAAVPCRRGWGIKGGLVPAIATHLQRAAVWVHCSVGTGSSWSLPLAQHEKCTDRSSAAKSGCWFLLLLDRPSPKYEVLRSGSACHSILASSCNPGSQVAEPPYTAISATHILVKNIKGVRRPPNVWYVGGTSDILHAVPKVLPEAAAMIGTQQLGPWVHPQRCLVLPLGCQVAGFYHGSHDPFVCNPVVFRLALCPQIEGETVFPVVLAPALELVELVGLAPALEALEAGDATPLYQQFWDLRTAGQVQTINEGDRPPAQVPQCHGPRCVPFRGGSTCGLSCTLKSSESFHVFCPPCAAYPVPNP